MARTKKAISIELKDAREKLGLTQPEMAEKLGVPFRTLQDWEGGVRTPKPLTQVGIMTKLGEMFKEG